MPIMKFGVSEKIVEVAKNAKEFTDMLENISKKNSSIKRETCSLSMPLDNEGNVTGKGNSIEKL